MSAHDPDGYLAHVAEGLGASFAVGQMFGKPCVKKNGKAAVAMFHGSAVFELADPAEALAIEGAELWDPSGKGRPMKAWVVVPRENRGHWDELARRAHGLRPRSLR